MDAATELKSFVGGSLTLASKLLLVAITLYDLAVKSFVGGSLTLASKLLLVAITLYDLVAIPEEEVYAVEGVDDEEPLTPL
ncbi:hypothetical protein ACOSP7_001860 [Xanthoceras sorbifolium]